MMGNYHVRFLGGKGAAMPPTYPIQQQNAVPHQTISDNNKIINNRYDYRCYKYCTHSDFTIATLFIKKEKV